MVLTVGAATAEKKRETNFIVSKHTMNSRSNSAKTRTKIIFRYLGLAIIIIHREQTINRGRSQKKTRSIAADTTEKK